MSQVSVLLQCWRQHPPQAHSSGASSELDVPVGPPLLHVCSHFQTQPSLGLAEVTQGATGFQIANRATRDCHLLQLPAVWQPAWHSWQHTRAAPAWHQSQGAPSTQRQLGKGAGTGSAEPHSCHPVSTAACPGCTSAPPASISPALPMGAMEDDPWDRLIAGSRVCPALLQRWCQEVPAALWPEGGSVPVLGPARLPGKMTGEAGDQHPNIYPGLQPAVSPHLQRLFSFPKYNLFHRRATCTSASSNGLKSTAIPAAPVGASCPEWEGI